MPDKTSTRFPSLSVKSLFLTLMLGITPCVIAAPSIQVGFSPEGTAQQVVLNTINQSQQSIRMMAYSFTSPVIVKALINARKRGVDVKVVVDEKGNRGKASVAAMNLLVNAGISVSRQTRPIRKTPFLFRMFRNWQNNIFSTGSHAGRSAMTGNPPTDPQRAVKSARFYLPPPFIPENIWEQ